jgi:hypothetical protein
MATEIVELDEGCTGEGEEIAVRQRRTEEQREKKKGSDRGRVRDEIERITHHYRS